MTRKKVGRSKSAAPKPGSKLAWLAAHPDHTDDELLTLAEASGIAVDRKTLQRMRWQLRTRFGIKSKTKRPTAAASSAEHFERVEPTARELKREALRKLIFELGFDDAREIFSEFSATHERMKDRP